jgi:hypothetical protein
MKELDDTHDSVQDYELLGGKKKGNNGFNYETRNDTKLIGRIQKLYPLVYQKLEIIKKIISLNFAYGILVERKKWKVNWAQFLEQVSSMGPKGHKPKLISQSRGKKRFVLVRLSAGHWVDNFF